jgi:hypothetical protein
MDWMGWILVVVIVLLPLALLCYSAVTTGIEIGRKLQPFVDSFFDMVAVIFGYSSPRTPRIGNRTNQIETQETSCTVGSGHSPSTSEATTRVNK